MEILSPEPPKQLDISLSDSSSGDDSVSNLNQTNMTV